MTDLRTAAQQALEYLGAPSAKLWPAGTQYRIIAALHAALAQQAEPVEPVAWIHTDPDKPRDIIRMAREAASEDGSIDRKDGKNVVLYAAKTSRFLERLAALVAAAEREACAKLAEATICDTHLPTGVRIYGTRVADAIRARGSA
jgi:hypothetical protein